MKETIKTGKSKKFAEQIRPIYEECVREGRKSLKQIAECLNNKKSTTIRGETWTVSTVKSLEQQLQISRSSSTTKPTGFNQDNVIEAADKFYKKEEIWVPN